MTFLPEQILSLLAGAPGLSDREVTNALRGAAAPQQPVNQAARALERQGKLHRRSRPEDGIIGNYLTANAQPVTLSTASRLGDLDPLAEDSIKLALQLWLANGGWSVSTAMGKQHGVDIRATRGKEVWLIEVKGCGSRDPMRVNYFLCVLGEVLQRMDDPDAKYSIALPDLKQFRRLWARLPMEAKRRTEIGALFVDETGHIDASAV